jgi:hypothetical protein
MTQHTVSKRSNEEQIDTERVGLEKYTAYLQGTEQQTLTFSIPERTRAKKSTQWGIYSSIYIEACTGTRTEWQ